ncbi:MAG: amidohydrolase family protein [Eubacteriales bacterium]|nr:amidohydrolase family protein [Eubacteriales bacterium]
MNKSFAVKGDFYYSRSLKQIDIVRDGYCIVEDGISKGVFESLPEQYKGIEVLDFSGNMILPGMIDLHTHAPQYGFRAVGLDKELLEWLETYTFPEESNYSNMEYADKSYDILADDLKKSWTTRCVLFGTIFKDSTLLLMDKLEKSGLCTYVGKVNMDRNAPEFYVEQTKQSVEDTIDFVREASERFTNTKPILTPRFIPTCSDELMEGLGRIQKETGIPAQSHLSENLSEIQWVSELCPFSEFYGDAYDHFGMFGTNGPTIMAHCVHSGKEEIERMKENGVFIAHCPSSNANLASGIAPIRRYLNAGLRVGMGSDIAGGFSLSIPDEMVRAVQYSKLRWRCVEKEEPLEMEEVFYLATAGGGEFFGKVGSFDEGYEFDAVVIDDSTAKTAFRVNDTDRLSRAIYLSHQCELKAKFVRGRKIVFD